MITFHTENLNRRLYQRMFQNLCLHTGIDPYYFLSKWDIHIYGNSRTEVAFFDHVKTTSGQRINPLMTSGVTGKNEMRLFLHDSNDLRKNMENSDRVQHEFMHARLYEKHNTVGGIWVTAVHEEPSRFKISFWYWKKVFWSKFTINCIDVRDKL